MCLHRPATWEGNRAWPPISECVSPVEVPQQGGHDPARILTTDAVVSTEISWSPSLLKGQAAPCMHFQYQNRRYRVFFEAGYGIGRIGK
jgi:hypothetical protein